MDTNSELPKKSKKIKKVKLIFFALYTILIIILTVVAYSYINNYVNKPLAFTMPNNGVISDYFSQYNKGIDIASESGNIVASEGGKVVKVGYSEDIGNYVVIKHKYGFESSYKYMGSVSVNVNQNVSKNQVIGTMGKSGKVSGPHIQFEIKYNNKYLDPLLLIN